VHGFLGNISGNSKCTCIIDYTVFINNTLVSTDLIERKYKVSKTLYRAR
jgi:hypothetical protein